MFAVRWFQKKRARGKRRSGPSREGGAASQDTAADLQREETAGIVAPCRSPEAVPMIRGGDDVSESGACLSTQRHRPMNLFDLPDEMLLHIIAYIGPVEESFVSLVVSCKRLYNVAQDPSLYHLTSLQVPAKGVFSFCLFQRVLDVSGSAMVRVDLSGCEDITDYALFGIAVQCDTLKDLGLSGCKQITNSGLRVIGKYLTHLQRLDISACPFITCAGVAHLFQMIGKTLTSINLSDCLGFRNDPHKLVSLAHFCSSLRYLSVGWSRDLVKLNPLLDMDVDRLTQGCTDLEYLDVSYSHSTNGSMQSIALNCPVLTTLIAKQCFLQDAGLEHIARGLGRLEWLDLTDCWYVTDAGLGSLATGCTHLRGVVLTRCHEVRGSGVVKMATACPNLESVCLRQCFRLDSHAVECVCLFAKRLRHIDVSYNHNVTVDTVRKIRESRGGDVRIVTDGCPRVPNGGATSRFAFSKTDSVMVWETAI